MESQQFEALHIGQSRGCTMTLTHNRNMDRLSKQKYILRHGNYVLKMRVTGASMILHLPSSKMMGLCNHFYPQLYNQQPLWAKMVATTWLIYPKITLNRASMERQWSVNGASMDHQWSINEI
jgi:hypothetical protein